jgi:hypothetical protein
MTKLVDKIERVMRKTNVLRLQGDYYYDARIMVEILRTWPHGSSIRQLCEKTFQIGAYEPGYHYEVETWETLVTEMTWLLEKTMAEHRMKKMREELIAGAMSPARVGSMADRYGASAACATFA